MIARRKFRPVTASSWGKLKILASTLVAGAALAAAATAAAPVTVTLAASAPS